MHRSTIAIIGPANNVHVHRWAVALVDHGWSVSLISPTSLTMPLPRSLAHMPCYVLPATTAGMTVAQRFATFLRGWVKVPGLIAALRPDLVHVHSLPTPAATLFLRRIPRLVVSVWGSDVVQRDRRKERWYPQLLVRAARVTATSHYLAQVTEGYLAMPRHIDIVPFGVDVERFVPADHAPTACSIGSLRHLEHNYGLDLLLQAMPMIKSLTNNAPVLHVGGAGSLAAQLREQARMLTIDRAVRWWGRVPHDDVPRFLQQLCVFAMPSRAESFGVAALEAQACGVPVVASNVGGLPEVVCDGETGLLVPPEDPRRLAEAIAVLLLDHDRRGMMGAAARQWVVERYRWDESVRRMLNVYDQILEG